jgi:hypothetical protein
MSADQKELRAGTFSASVDGVRFMGATTADMRDLNFDYYLFGSENNNRVVFSVPSSLQGDGPHEVKFYKEGVKWQVQINGQFFDADQNSKANISFVRQRRGAYGTIDFVLTDGRKITGDFNINII